MANFKKEKFLNIGAAVLSVALIGGFVSTVMLDLNAENPSDFFGQIYEKKLNEMAYDLTGSGVTKTAPEMREYLFNKEVKNNPLKANKKSEIEKMLFSASTGTESINGAVKRVVLTEKLKEIGAFEDAKKFDITMKTYSKEHQNNNANEEMFNNVSANIQKLRVKMTENKDVYKNKI